MFRPFANWLSTTSLSQSFQDTLWLVPVSQSIHNVCIGVVFGIAMIINARLLGLKLGGITVSQLNTNVLPWMWRALWVLLATGIVQTITEPVRQFITPIFWFKMMLIIVITILTVRVSRSISANPAKWDNPATQPSVGRAFAVTSIVLWCTIMVFGRFIGYVWAYYI